MDINDPAQTASFLSISMNPVMAWAAKGSEVFVTTQPLPRAARLMMEVSSLLVLATFALWMEGKIRLLGLAVFIVFTLSFAGCIPQPTAALEALQSFQWKF